MERGPQGVQLPLQQGEIQGSAAHGGGSRQKRVGSDGPGSAVGAGGGEWGGVVQG